MLKQILKIIKLLGLRRAAKMKKNHALGLNYIRGYAATTSWWTLLNQGLLDELLQKNSINLTEYTRCKPCELKILHAIVEYLDGIDLLNLDGDNVSLTETGINFLAEPRGLLELLWAYEPCFANLPDMLAGKKKYGSDLTRRITYVGLGSGRLCEQLPYPIMRRMTLEHRRKMVIDLGCGDLAFLAGLCKIDPEIRCHGIDFSPEMIEYNNQKLKSNNYNSRLTNQIGDMFDLPEFPENLLPIDCVTACDTFHEYLDNPDRIINLLKNLKTHFPGAIFIIGEFCLQNPQWLKKHKTASLEHHLFHQLSNQQIGSAKQWQDIFQKANLQIIEQQVFDLIGHGYFALK